jgi:hypothetical protein
MKHFLFFIVLIVSYQVYTQTNLTVFNNEGQLFYVILNGIKQNSVPQTNVSVSGIKNGGYSVKLIFADGKTPDIDKNFFIEEPSDITTKVVFKKGKGKIQLVSMLPTSGTVNQSAVSFRQDNSTQFSDATQQVNSNSQQIQTTQSNSSGNVQLNSTSALTPISNTQTTTTTTTTQSNESNLNNNGMNVTINDPVTNENIQMNLGLNMNGNELNDPIMNGNLNLNVNIGSTNGFQTNSSSTITTTSTSQTINSGSNIAQNNSGNVSNTTGASSSNVNSNTSSQNGNILVNSTSQNNLNSGYMGNLNCTKALTDFNGFMEDLNSHSFEDDKMETIKLSLEKTCLTHTQSFEIVKSLTFEGNRFEIAKFLYVRTLDKQLSEKGILPLFTFDSTKMEWREFVREN